MRLLKKHAYTLLFSTVLLSASVYVLLKIFVIPSTVTKVAAEASSTTAPTETGEVITTDTSYQDDNISITITTGNTSNTTYYVADITLSSADYLKAVLAQDTFGTNITETTSSTASSKNAIFIINGDYYGVNTSGYVIKNNVIYRSIDRQSDYDGLVIYLDGSFGTFNESDTIAQKLLDSGAVNTFAFGLTFVSDGQTVVSESEEVGQVMTENPRTVIGIIETDDGSLHYIVIVSDGRTDEPAGLTLYEMTELMQLYGMTTACNLDGGGSSTTHFNGKVINNPTTSGNTIEERAVGDTVYIGY